ncbi:Inorganic pyrophosphatase [Kappamyces sp. JEL0829]|nr:Inorganic pyrophosphatase [Kappamyces sp. JEL0829]
MAPFPRPGKTPRPPIPTPRFQRASHLQAKGDCDPLDVIEIGELVGYTGQVKQVIAIDVKDPLAAKLNDIEDVEKNLPGLLRATNEWFRIYKIPDGKPENNFAFSGEAKNKKYTDEVIHECHEAWKRLIQKGTPVCSSGVAIPNKSDDYNINTANSTVQESPYKVASDDEQYKAVPKHAPLAPAAIDPSIDKWVGVDCSR